MSMAPEAVPEDHLIQRDLFGGAITMHCPERMTDVSDFRPVPDSQEVFADAGRDQSLIVEVMEHIASVPDLEASAYYLQDMASQNEAIVSTTDPAIALGAADIPGVPETAFKVLISGMQLASKGRQGKIAAIAVQVLLLVVRLPEHASDLLISMNTPTFKSQGSAAAEHAGSGAQTMQLTAPALFREIISTLKIVDCSLFGNS